MRHLIMVYLLQLAAGAATLLLLQGLLGKLTFPDFIIAAMVALGTGVIATSLWAN